MKNMTPAQIYTSETPREVEDIVFELRFGNPCQMRLDAADTIERLERELAQAIKERDELAQWKKKMVFTEKAWNPQEVGELLGMPLGADIRANIKPRIKKIQHQLATATEALERIVGSGNSHGEILETLFAKQALAAIHENEREQP